MKIGRYLQTCISSPAYLLGQDRTGQDRTEPDRTGQHRLPDPGHSCPNTYPQTPAHVSSTLR